MTNVPAGDLLFKPFGDPEHAEPPQRMSKEAVGYDFYAEEIIHEDRRSIWYRTGYGVAIPSPLFGDLRARSSVSETGLLLANGAGIVDPDYRGEVQFRFYKIEQDSSKRRRNVDVYEPGDRIGQMILVRSQHAKFTGVSVVDEWPSETERGEGGFGSTGK